MKVYLVDKYKIKDYSLPTKVEDSFVIEYISATGVEENILFTAVDGQWTIASDYDVTIYKDIAPITQEIIKDGSFYTLKFRDLEDNLTLYCFDIPINYQSYNIFNSQSITIGGANSDINYSIMDKKNPIITLTKDGIRWIFETKEDFNIFVNGKRYHKKILNLGDVIFVKGLKIIFMDKFIKINNPNNFLSTNLEVKKELEIEVDNKFTPVKESEKRIVLYNENQTFFHNPRLKKEINHKKIKIANPPTKREDEEPPLILTLGATMMMSLSSSITGIIAIFNVISGKGTLASSLSEIIICISMILGTIMFPILLNRYTKRLKKKKERKRQERYTAYLNKKKAEIDNEIKLEREILYENNLNTEECLNSISTKNKLWNREIADSDFLTIRLGTGNKKASITIDASLEEFSMEDDNLKDDVQKLIDTPLILENVPITISLIENPILPLIINPDFKNKELLINSIILQLVTYYSAMDLKIVILTNEENEYIWEDLKYSPYCISVDKQNRFFATNDEDTRSISTILEEIYNSRSQNSEHKAMDQKDGNDIYKNYNEYYLIITDNFISAKKINIINKIINSSKNYGFSLLTIDESLKNVPSKSNKFVQVSSTSATISSKNLSDEDTTSFIVEVCDKKIEKYLEVISNIPLSSSTSKDLLPTNINFLEMYKVGKIEQLNILNRWISSDPTSSLSTPIGVNEDGKIFNLDLHEKYQGPHGLIAGATGSGKSEFIITFILSLAMNYHPYEVQFVLIDYKGGGLAGAFENRESKIKLPHLVGTITNLDKSEMNRTLVSIKSELQRRQRLFNLARESLGESTIDIYKYQRYYRDKKVTTPISHLFIISDEFAELKAQQPDFMEELVSTARIGRSLGVHLILATQKPSGVVDDQIWSNARFKICLKVQTPEDSVELLKRPDAASINETGRFYLQVGYDELFELGQSAWAGARYFPTDRLLKSYDDDIVFINNIGEEIKTINDVTKLDVQKDMGDQLSNLVKYMYDLAIRENVNFTQLWLPSIPKEIYLADLLKKYNYQATKYKIAPLVGEYDIPTKQEQKPLIFDFTTDGNMYLFGNPGSGKENLLMSTIYSTCLYHSTEEINIYILDFGAEVLKTFSEFPQVGDVILSDNASKAENLFDMLNNELNRRKELFSSFGGDYNTYISSGNKTPFIMVIVNNYENFYDTCSDIAIESFEKIIRDSSKYGIIFIITVTANNNISTRTTQYCNIKMATQVADPFDYKFVLNAPAGLVPAKNFGRGIIAIGDTAYEFQSALIYIKEKIADAIKEMGEKLPYEKARKIPIIPKEITSDYMIPYINTITDVPIGINIYNGLIMQYNFTGQKITPIIGNSILIDNKFILNLIKEINSIPTIKLRVLDFADRMVDLVGDEYYINSEFTQAINDLKNINDKMPNVYILNGISLIYDKVLDEGINSLFEMLRNIDNYPNTYFILCDNYASFRKTMREDWYINSSINNAIWIGKNVDTQDVIKLNKVNKCDLYESNNYVYVISADNYEILKGIGASEF